MSTSKFISFNLSVEVNQLGSELTEESLTEDFFLLLTLFPINGDVLICSSALTLR